MPQSERLYMELAHEALHLDHQFRRLPPEQRAEIQAAKAPDADANIRDLIRTMGRLNAIIDEMMELILEGN